MPDGALQVIRCFEKSQIDYSQLYIHLFIAYSAWYQRTIGTTSDRQALNQLKKRFIIWEEYLDGRALDGMTHCMLQLVEYTQREPLAPTTYWVGFIKNKADWQSLIEFWYQVRCLLVHGSEVDSQYVQLAYDSLYIFMDEIITRMRSQNTNSPNEFWNVDMNRSFSSLLWGQNPI